MRAVFKYRLPNYGQVSMMMPRGAKPLHVAEEMGGVSMWAEVDDSQPPEARIFLVRSTGAAFNGDEGRYVGTVVANGGLSVWHVYEPARMAAQR